MKKKVYTLNKKNSGIHLMLLILLLANVIPTFIKARPLIVGGNSRGDMDMLNQSCGLKIVVNPDDITVRDKDDGPMSGYTVRQYWEKEGAVVVKCNDVPDPKVTFHTARWKIKTNISNPK